MTLKIDKSISVKIYELPKSIWDYIRDENNWITNRKDTLIDICKSGEFPLWEFSSLESFDEAYKEALDDGDFDAETINFYRTLLEYFLQFQNFDNTINKIYINYTW